MARPASSSPGSSRVEDPPRFLYGPFEPSAPLVPCPSDVVSHTPAAGTLTIIPVCRLARRVWNPRAALAAAFFLAVAVLHVRDSHFAMTDVLMTLFVMLSLARLVAAFDAVFEEPSTGAPKP